MRNISFDSFIIMSCVIAYVFFFLPSTSGFNADHAPLYVHVNELILFLLRA